MKQCVNKLLQGCQGKDDIKADGIRKQGNNFYVRKAFKESCEYYSKGLSFATYKSELYGTILANRSAALFMLNQYEVSITRFVLLLVTRF